MTEKYDQLKHSAKEMHSNLKNHKGTMGKNFRRSSMTRVGTAKVVDQKSVQFFERSKKEPALKSIKHLIQRTKHIF